MTELEKMTPEELIRAAGDEACKQHNWGRHSYAPAVCQAQAELLRRLRRELAMTEQANGDAARCVDSVECTYAWIGHRYLNVASEAEKPK